jgi:hypothetical protein
MQHKTAVVIVLIVALGGVIFSGYLSYTNLWGNGCEHSLISCGGAKAVKIFGQPTCVYGFFMFLIEVVLAIFALTKQNKKPLLKWIFGVGIFGLAFAGVLALYEIIWLNAFVNGIPACLYGFFFYLLIFIFAMVGLRYKGNDQIQPTATVRQ